ncbi:hypothetical protein GCM10011348_45710 [Marinobacterium nitratireducens]|uniref:exo-alpha-sialidase n=1 Tax=Marinobacterium nitratireducens TaxID=518897 RepID=A0A917ZQH9_9GAMM|nr:hypothetical protein GCM10011348_45710 [Marinobacterium nitratireducens]
MLVVAMEAGSAPAAPSSLVAARDGGYTAVWVTWSDNSSNETGFELQYDTDSGFGSPTTVYPAANRTLHRITGLTRGQTYYFRIRATNGAGNSAWSNSDSATVFQLSDVTLYAEYDANAGVYTDSGTTPVASDGDAVGQVQDQTGNGRHITQTTPSAKPVWKTSQLNGLPTIRHAAGDILKAATASDWKFMHDGTEFAAYIVWKTTSANPNAVYVILDTGGVASGGVGVSLEFDDRSGSSFADQLRVNVSKASAGNYEIQSLTAAETVKSGAWHVSALRLNSTVFENYNDSHLGGYSSDTPDGAPSTSNPTSALAVGGRENNTLNLVGDWARIFIVSGTVSDANHQAIQDYLSEDYAFRNAWFGDSVVVQHDTSGLDHNDFPGLGLASNSTLILGYSKNTSHPSQDGELVVRSSSDAGETWSAESVLWDYSTDGGGTDLWFTPRFTTLGDNRVLMAVGLRVNQSPVVDGIGYFESNDNGATWTGPTQITGTVFTDWAAEGGGVLELANGDLLYPYYGKDTGDAANRRSSAVMRSTDGGSTWTHLAMVADGPADARDYVEPGLFQRNNGDVVAMIRDNLNESCRIAVSTDNGATWGSVSYAADVGGLMTPLKLSTGEIIAPQRANDTGRRCQVLFSPDDGVTWQLGHKFDESPNFTNLQMIYGQFQEGSSGELYLAYAQEDSAASVADVMFSKTQ